MNARWCFLALFMAGRLAAVETHWHLQTQHKKNLKDFVIAAYPAARPPVAAAKNIEMMQKGKSFQPGHIVIQVGSTVTFPNKDDTAHSIYSFSQAKKFTVDLYKSTDKVPELKFDEEGVVILGCNIHDWMVGTIVVVNTPYYLFSSSDDAVLELPPGEYGLKIWHREVNMEKLSTINRRFTVENKPGQDFVLNVDIKAGDNW